MSEQNNEPAVLTENDRDDFVAQMIMRGTSFTGPLYEMLAMIERKVLERAADHSGGATEMVDWSDEPAAFQARVQPWMMECFGAETAADHQERNHRFLEEALELVQACGATASEAHQLVDYVYGRPIGDKHQEVGGVMVTLAALCLAQGLDMHVAGETELARIWTKVEQIRAKQAAKPKHSPLPEHVDTAYTVPVDAGAR